LREDVLDKAGDLDGSDWAVTMDVCNGDAAGPGSRLDDVEEEEDTCDIADETSANVAL
jgi:hypothetical protein